RHVDTINDLARNDLVAGLLKFKYNKEHLCPLCEQGKKQKSILSTKASSKFKAEITSSSYGFVWIASINGKRYILVIVDDYSRYTWVHFLRSKDEAPETLVEAARTMLIFSRAPLFLWAEAIANACFTQNHSIFHRRFNKTPYELINGRKPNISFLHVFGALCYPKNDREDIGKLGAKVQDITKQPPTEGELDLLFEAMYDDYFGRKPSASVENVPPAQEPQVRQSSTVSTTIADTALIPTNSSSNATNIPITLQNVDELNSNAMVDGNTFVNPFANSSTSA
nr:integrase, catalytic region, zinc finger, CCHC-type, peptidase aspartic, catalytic [Tanacetum cinerariifolium]